MSKHQLMQDYFAELNQQEEDAREDQLDYEYEAELGHVSEAECHAAEWFGR